MRREAAAVSFSSDVKKELCRVSVKMKEIERSEAYGLLLFCRRFSPSEISMRTESGSAAERFADVTARTTGAVVELQKTLTARKTGGAIYKAFVPSSDDCARIFAQFGHDASAPSLRVNMGNIEFEPCAAAFLRGAFLTCGTISSPESEYRLEFNTVHKNLSDDLCRVIKETMELAGGRAAQPRVISRRGSYFVYLKDSDDIADLLTLMGAGSASMSIMQVKIEKSRENSMNRKINSQIANTDKTVSAAAKQVRAIRTLEENGVLTDLSGELQAAAALRRDHPIASLKELVSLSPVPISKSGLNHRLNKLVELAGEQ